MPPPIPTPIYRLTHRENLATIIPSKASLAPNMVPSSNQLYRKIHDQEVQSKRRNVRIPCGPGGVIHDYVPFYFGYLSPMLLNLKTGRVPGFSGGQSDLIYLVTACQKIKAANLPFVFSDGHALTTVTAFSDDLNQLQIVDWGMVNQRYWTDTPADPDRQRRKQAEFLVHQKCPWDLIESIAVFDESAMQAVMKVLGAFPLKDRRSVSIRRDWYYY